MYFIDGPKALNCGIQEARVTGISQASAWFRWVWAFYSVLLGLPGCLQPPLFFVFRDEVVYFRCVAS